MKVLVIIPAYNEEENIVHTIHNLTKTCPFVDYIIVNDASTDRTEEVCRKHGFSYISLPMNLGIGGAMQTGYQYASSHGYEIAIQFDGDGQHNADYILKLIEPIEKHDADMVIGSRFIDKEGFQTSGMRRVGIRILNGAIKLCSGLAVTDATSGFRAVSKSVIDLFAHNYAQDYPEPESIMAVHVRGYQVKEVAVVMNERTAGVSSISPMKSMYYMIKVTLAILIYKMVGKR